MKTMGRISIFQYIILYCSVLCIRCQFSVIKDAEETIIGDSVPLILKFLNDDVEAIISYNSGKIKHSLLKGNLLEVDITASVTCKFPSEQCNHESADCSGLLFVKPNTESQVISVVCNPNSPLEEPIALPVQEQYCEGCMVDVNVNGEGVEQLADNVIQHVESEKGKKYNLIQVLKVQRQVTNGVNFEITVLIGRPPLECDKNQKCERDSKEDMYCLVKFFQEPGYYAPKNIISNNCTQTQTFLPVMPKYQSNDINKLDADDGKTDYKGKGIHTKNTESSENDILKEIISQIVPSDEIETKPIKNMEAQLNSMESIETSSANDLVYENGQPLIASSTFQEILATEDEPISIGTDTSMNQNEMENSDTITRGSSIVGENQQKALQQTEDNTQISSQSTNMNEDTMSATSDNNSVRQKRSLLGGKQEIDVDDPNIKEYIGEPVDYLNTKLSRGDRPLKIGKISSATSQVVSGVSYDIKAELTDCDLNSVEDCKNVPSSFVHINIWYRPWRNSRIITIKFNGLTYSFDALRTKNRKKRESLVGGWSKKDYDEAKVMKHLGVLLTNLDSQSDMNNKLKIKEILSVSTQVVAGTNWLIKAKVSRSDCSKSEQKEAVHCEEDKNSFETLCSFKFWEKLPDENRLRKLDNIEIDCEEPKSNYRSKRSIHERKTRGVSVGGHNPLSKDDPRIAKHLENLLPQSDSLSDKEHKLKVKNIISATSQVVAGTNWNIKATVSLSDCKKGDDKLSSTCGDNTESYETICEFKFWERLPDKKGERKLDDLKIECEDAKLNKRNKREIQSEKLEPQKDLNIPGGQINVDINEPEIYEFLSESLRHMDLNSPYDRKFKIKEVLSSTKQVVSGYIWKIKVAIVLSDCNKNDVTEWAQCRESEGAEPKHCLIKVWNRPWIQQGREINITCDNQKDGYFFRSKKSMESQHLSIENNELLYPAFKEFEKTYTKQYSSPKERIHRFSIFKHNMQYIKLSNQHEQGTGIYGPTRFADLTQEEFSKRLGYRSDLRSENEIAFPKAEIPNIEVPDAFDWREKNAVTEVKNQGSCGSCWAFSVTGNVEGQYAIKNGKLLEFSEQESVDCDKEDQGCNGGLMDNAYRQIEKLGGLEQEQDYPYDGRDEKCHLNKTLVRVELAGAVNISQDETEMTKWSVQNGPISIAINANAMQFYMGGVSHPWKMLCNPKSLDHGVLIVGYGVHTYPKFKKSLPYWIVKNSWGKSWGEQGYYRVYRGDGTCGVNQTPSSAILK